MSLLLTHCILNKLSHPIYWTSPFSLFNLFHLFIYFFFFCFFFLGGGGGVGYSVSPLIYFLTTKNTVVVSTCGVVPRYMYVAAS